MIFNNEQNEGNSPYNSNSQEQEGTSNNSYNNGSSQNFNAMNQGVSPAPPPQRPSYKYPKQYQGYNGAGGYNSNPNPQFNGYYPPPSQYYMPYHPYGYSWLYNPEFQLKQKMKKDVGFGGLFSIFIPLALNIIAIIAVLVVTLVVKPPAGDSNLGLGFYGYQILNGGIYLFSFLLCIIFVPMIFKRKMNPFARFPSASLSEDDKKGPGFLVLLASLLVALSLCIVANIITSIIMAFLLELGLPYPALGESPTDLLGLALSVLFTAVFPAIFEEVIWRGYILRSLRPYGDLFAVVVSSLFFGLMHGNIVQIPFAFMIGMVCGWLVIKTNSIWPSVAIHFLNNFMAVVLNYAGKQFSNDEAQTLMMFGAYGIIIAAGIGGLIILLVAKSPMTYFKKQYKGQIQKGKVGIVFSSGGFWVCLIITFILVVISILASMPDVFKEVFDPAKEVMANVFKN